ncbi:MAG: Crossover junction endodeoxyribonuclease RuvC [Parcubacteria group bacterium GW2011_GWF2_43_11]|nr:MAG: Crossover junction endodeoxyribonuclease RuvC [Parcubacteria group bacterium GW2011_GWF2_43_11]
MIILGIDPGTATTGYGVILAKSMNSRSKDNFKCLGYGSIKTSPEMAMPQRLKKLHNELSRLLKEHQPEIMVVESLFFFKNMKTAMPVSQAKGVILLTAAKKNILVHEFTPPQVKMLVAGSGKAEKINVQKKVQAIFGMKDIPKPDDAADALAIALTYVFARNA